VLLQQLVFRYQNLLVALAKKDITTNLAQANKTTCVKR